MIELRIDKLTHGGRGMGRWDGKAVFVPLTCPGDLVRCTVTRDKQRFAEAELVELLEASPLRREPPCPLFGECGGCQWQHLPYPLQCDWKSRLFREQLTRCGAVDAACVADVAAASAEFAYRNRAQFKCHATESGIALGFYRSGSHFVVDADRCLLVDAPIRHAAAFMRDALTACPAPASVPQLDIGCDAAGAVELVLHALPEAVEDLYPWLAEVACRGGFAAFLQSGRKQTLQHVYGTGVMTHRVGSDPVTLQAGPGCFVQVNTAQNSRMIDHVLEMAELRGTERVLDLFCGIGNFSLPLARQAAELVGVEDYAPSIASARRNAVRNGIDNARFHVGSAAGALERYRDGGPFDLVVLDPPRSGCYDVARELVRQQPRRVIYVSCDAATLARDLKLLVHNGYRVIRSQPLDLFPQTWHVESVTLLLRQD